MFTPPRIVSPVRSPKRQTPAKGCGTSRGLGQLTNTCWFNSPLNGFILAEGTSKMILEQISKLSPTNVISLSKSFPEDSCPLTLSKKYIYYYFMKIHSKQPVVVGRSQNVSVNLIGKLFTPKRLPSPTANGRRGGQTGVAALQIMKILFGDENIVYLPGWQNFVPNGIGNRRILYRYGYPPPGEYRTLHSQPMFMKSRDGETFKLSHMVYTVSISAGPHAVVAYVCGNKRYIYDANKFKNFEVDWSNPKNIKKILKYSDASEIQYVSYTLYVRK